MPEQMASDHEQVLSEHILAQSELLAGFSTIQLVYCTAAIAGNLPDLKEVDTECQELITKAETGLKKLDADTSGWESAEDARKVTVLRQFYLYIKFAVINLQMHMIFTFDDTLLHNRALMAGN